MTTARKTEIQPAYTMKGDREVRDGWDLFVDGGWHERFRTKREAKAEILRLAMHDASFVTYDAWVARRQGA